MIILASNSPRRKELLAGLGVPFKVLVIPGIDESYPDTLPASEIAEYIAIKKAAPYTVTDGNIVITADTVVVCDGEVMGKPSDEAEAYRMLRHLSGKTHQVYTGVCIKTSPNTNSSEDDYDGAPSLQGRPGKEAFPPEGAPSLRGRAGGEAFTVCTDVTFRELTDEEIWHYIREYKPFDKAGAYGIQEWIGYIGITAINGSYYNVMGLPVQRIYQELQAILPPSVSNR